jgi:transposase InsO family protein
LRGAHSGSIESFRAELRAWEDTYNRVRPHQALGYLTPAEFLASLGIDEQRTCRTSSRD